MITCTGWRQNGERRANFLVQTFDDPLEALGNLVRAEFNFGCRVLELTERRITTETTVISCVDTTTFEGPEQEMRPLVELCALYTEAGARHGELFVDQVVETIDRIPERHIGTPLLLMMASPMIVGRSRLRAAVMLACGVQNEDDIRAGLDARVEDLVAAVQLSRDGQCTFREALAR